MGLFYVEKGTNEAGEHVIHSSTCSCLPAEDAMHYMGAYVQAPIWEAYLRYSKVTTCRNCIPA